MYVLTSPDKSTIVIHVTNTPELAEVVKNYIESGHNCKIDIVQREGLVYYDCPGAKCINKELYDVNAGEVRVGIIDIDILACYFKREKPDFSRGFMRIPSYHCHICLTEKEWEDTRDWFEKNDEVVSELVDKATEIICGKKDE